MQIYKTSKARENIFSKIRKELSEHPLPSPYPSIEKDFNHLYIKNDNTAEEVFASSFIALGGKFIFCEHEQEFLENINLLYENKEWQNLLCADKGMLKLFQNRKIDIVKEADISNENADACITGCEMLVARTGSIIFSSKQNLGRSSSVFYPVHIVFAYANQIVWDIEDGINVLRKKYGEDLPSMINLTTGPSRTADIEKTLVVGVHGPGEIFCFFINAEKN